MTIDRTIFIEGKEYPLTLSDESETLLAAKAAGRVVVGISKCEESCTGEAGSEIESEAGPGSAPWLPVDYVAAGLPVDEAWLEGVARRQLGIPWKIAESNKLIIREFSLMDVPDIPSDADDSSDEAILKDPRRLQAYIKQQYAFFNCGMWAVVRKEDGKIVGMVSLTPDAKLESLLNISDPDGADSDPLLRKDLVFSRNMTQIIPSIEGEISYPQPEGVCALGYHIYAPCRRLGYAKEACAALIDLLGQRHIAVSVYTDPANTASIALLKALDFVKVGAPFNCFLHLNSV